MPATGQNTGISGTRHTALDFSAAPQYADSGADGYLPTAGFDAISDPDDDEPEDSGIAAILGDMATTEVPGEEAQSPQPELNPLITPEPPRPVGSELESQPGTFGGISGGTGGGAPAGNGGTLFGTGSTPHRVRDLSLDQRLRIWRWRVAIMLVVGVVFTIVVNWPVGLSLAILAAIIDTVYRSRTVAQIPYGGSPTRAQRRTRRQLARMRRAGYLTLHARPIPDSIEVIDHLVVGPTGVYAIDSERWRREMPIRTRNGKQLWHGPDSKRDRLDHARWEAQQASDRLSAALGTEIPVRAAMAVYGPRVPWDIATIREVDVFSGPRLRLYLRRRGRMKDLPRLTPDKVRTIYNAAGTVLPGVAPTRTATPVG